MQECHCISCKRQTLGTVGEQSSHICVSTDTAKYIHSRESAILGRSYWQSVLSGYVTICQGVRFFCQGLPYFVRVCNNLSGWALFCQGVPYFVRVCYILSWYAIFCEGPLNFVRVHKTRHLWGSESTLWGFYCLWGCTLTNTFWTLTKYWYHNSTHTNINPPRLCKTDTKCKSVVGAYGTGCATFMQILVTIRMAIHSRAYRLSKTLQAER